MIDLTRVRAFIIAAETLSFSETSKQMNLTQPTISHHIKTLEKNLGVQLFERKGNQLVLTEAGTMLIPWARKLIAQSNQIKDMMEAIQDRAVGNLRIACSAASGKYVLPHLAARFRNRFPDVLVSILPCASGEVAKKLLKEEAHLAVVTHEFDSPSIQSQTLYVDTIRMIVPSGHPWGGSDDITPCDLLDQKIIMREPTSGSRRVVLSELSKHDIQYEDLNVFMELGNAEGIVQAVGAGYGISFVTENLALEAKALGKVEIVDLGGWALHRRVFMVRRSLNSPQRVTEAFWSFVHDPSNRDLLPLPFNL
ncbi:MAG: LysR family transcriptional regulator [Anaerolineales bacterium]|nr:LysR family transcriptional regulator [Anaerolineales bacterium]